MILKLFLSIALFISGGHIVSTNFKLHHYSDKDYKDIFYLKNNNSITKHCLRHSKSEDINKKTSYYNGERKTIYKVAKNEEKDSSVKTS
jgi:hypothetical protein|tara:strand:+ start:482 stop:748 length:267 start_codon:yes stop_codon:yes gene_type:complete